MRRILSLATAGSVAIVLSLVAVGVAHPPATPLSGAIFTTDVTGVPVNLNHYAAKEDVYLNGGPGINAPDDAAGLPAGTYYVPGDRPVRQDAALDGRRELSSVHRRRLGQ